MTSSNALIAPGTVDSFDVGHQAQGEADHGRDGQRRPAGGARPAFGFDTPDPAPAPSPAADGALRL